MESDRRVDLERLLNAEVNDPAARAQIAERFLSDPKNRRLVEELARASHEEEGVVEGVAAETEALVRAISHSSLLPLHPEGSLGISELFSLESISRLTGVVVSKIDDYERTQYEVHPSREKPSHFVFSTSEELPDVVPACVVAARLSHYPRKPAVTSFAPAALGIEDSDQLLGMAAKSPILEDQVLDHRVLTAHSPDLEGELDPTLLLLAVSGTMPEDRDSDAVIASLRLQDRDGEWYQQDRVVDLQTAIGTGRRLGETGFDWPRLSEWVAGELIIRSLADADVHFLDSRQVVDALALAELHVAFPLRPHPEGYAFQVRPCDRERLSGETALGWFLQVSPSLED